MSALLIGRNPSRKGDDVNTRAVALLCLAGAAVAVLSGMYESYGMFAQICAAFSDGCKQTLGFTLLGYRLWMLGAIYFVLLCASVFFLPAATVWLVGVGLGFEAELARTLVAMKAPCMFCIANGVFVVLSAAFVFRSRHFWQMLALALLSFILVQQGLTRPVPKAPAQAAQAAAAPKPDIAKLPIDRRYVMGPDDAPVTVVEFSDYQCPGCKRVHESIKVVRPLYEGKIRWIFKDFPLQMHPFAARAAQAARCAGDQGKFWDYQDLLYAAQGDLPDDLLKQFGQQLGLNGEAFGQCLSTDKYKAAVEASIQDADNARVDRTPSFFINGEPLPGVPTLEGFKHLIDQALEQSKAQKQ